MLLALGLVAPIVAVHGVVHHASVEWILLLLLGLVIVGNYAATDDTQCRRVLALSLLLGSAAGLDWARQVVGLGCHHISSRVLLHL